MKRSLQEVVELVVFGLIALLLGTGLLWLVGSVFGLVGTLLGWLAGLLWALLRFVVPVALIAGAVVFLVRAVRGRDEGSTAPTGTRVATPTEAPTVDAEPATAVAADHATAVTGEPGTPVESSPAPSLATTEAGAPDDLGDVDAGDAEPDRRPD